MIKRLGLFVTLVALCTLIGCSTAAQKMGFSSSGEPVAASLDEMPPDAAKVTRAIGNRLGGYAMPPDVRLDRAVNQTLASRNVLEPGFQVKSACLSTYATTGSASRQAAGRMELCDGLGRSAAVAFETAYAIQDDHTVINTVTIRPLFDTTPATVCFVVPAESADLKAAGSSPNFAALYNYLGQRALDPQTVIPGERKNYLLAVFFLNRMSPSAKATVAVSDSPSGIQGYSKDSRYMDYNGWRVGLLSGNMALKNPKTESSVYLKAVYTPGKEAGFLRMAKLAGVYAMSQKE